MTPPAPTLFPDMAPCVAAREYLPSVQYGGIAEVFSRVVTHYVPPTLPRPVIVDVTHRVGQFWERCANGYRVVRLDLDGSCPVDAVADWRSVPVRSGIADAVVFDPPWSQNNRGAARERYSAPFNSVGQLLDACAPAEWARVSKLDGLLFLRCMTSHHEHGVFFDLPHILKTRFAPWWTTYDEVMYAHGTRKPNQTMNRPKTWKCHSWFIVMERTEVAKIPQEKRERKTEPLCECGHALVCHSGRVCKMIIEATGEVCQCVRKSARGRRRCGTSRRAENKGSAKH